MALVLSGAGIYARTLASQRVAASGMPQLAQLPSQLEHWFSEDLPLSESVAAVLAADATLQRVYRHPSGAEVLVFLAYFAEQQVNSQIHSPRNCVPGGGSNVVTVEPGLLQLAGKTLPMTAMVLEKLGQRQEMLYWFRTRGGTVTGEYALKMDLVRNALARRPTDAVFVRYLAPAEHADAMRALIAALDPHLEAILGGVGL